MPLIRSCHISALALLSLIAVLATSAARAENCPYGNTNPSCPNNQIAERAAQERAQEEARERAQQEARERAQEEARERAQEEARERAQQEAQQRTSGGRSYPPAPNDTPHSYTPASSGASRTYTPGGSNGAERPPGGRATTYTPHGYTPGGASPDSAASSGTRVYTPHTYTPRNKVPSDVGVRTSSGATVYTPRAPQESAAGDDRATAGEHSETPRRAASISGTSRVHPVVLTPTRSRSVLDNLNTQRARLSGLNRRAIPAGQVSRLANGGLSVRAAGGREFTLRRNGVLKTAVLHDESLSFHANGHPARFHNGTMEIVHGLHGGRTVIVHGPNHSLFVSTGPHRGYVQRDIVLHGRNYLERTVIVGRSRTVRLYSSYTFHGVVLTHYVPRYFYAPAFYGWAYYPWVAPASYAWAWAGAPWYAFYGPYFLVSPVYPGPYAWLTDYYVGQMLAGAYDVNQPDGAQDPSTGPSQDDPDQPADANVGDPSADAAPDDEVYAQADTPISPEIKQSIAQEVQQQLAYENGAASAQPDQAATLDDLPQVLQPGHVFVVDADLNATTSQDQVCTLSTGNVLRLRGRPADDDAVADLVVISSRRADCPAGAHVELSLDNLEEMHNAFRARLDEGLATLRQQQGHNGIPAAPGSAIAPPPRPTDYPAPDAADTAAMLDSARQQATQAETDMTSQVFAANTAQ